MIILKSTANLKYALMPLAVILLVFGQGIAYWTISMGLTLFNIHLSIMDIIYWLQNVQYFGYAAQSIGLIILGYFTFKTKFKLNISQAKKSFLKSSILAACLCIVIVFSALSTPMVKADLLATTNYYLETPLPIASAYVGQYTNSSYFAISGANWNNFFVDTNKTLVLETAKNSITSGLMYLGDGVTWDYVHLTVPDNVIIEEHNDASIRYFINPLDAQGSGYTVSVGSGADAGYYFAQDSADRYCYSSTVQDTVMANVFSILTSGTTQLNQLPFNISLLSSIPANTLVVEDYNGITRKYGNTTNLITRNFLVFPNNMSAPTRWYAAEAYTNIIYFTSTGVSNVCQQCQDTMLDGGDIALQLQGTVSWESSLKITNRNVNLHSFYSWHGETNIMAAGGLNAPMINITANGFSLTCLGLDGNGSAQIATTDMIVATGATELVFEHLQIAYAARTGLAISNANGHYLNDIVIDYCDIGLQMSQVYYAVLHGLQITLNDYGLYLQNCRYVSLTGVQVYQNDEYGVLFENCQRITYSTSAIYLNGFHGLWLAATKDCTFGQLSINNNGQTTTNTYDNIYLSNLTTTFSVNNTFTGINCDNSLTNKARYNLNEANNGQDFNQYMACSFANALTADSKILGANSRYSFYNGTSWAQNIYVP